MGWFSDRIKQVSENHYINPASRLFNQQRAAARLGQKPRKLVDVYRNPLTYVAGGPGNVWGGLAAAGLSGGFNYWSQKETNRENRRLAEQQMAFQERMAATAHQREVRDLRLAGLNPTLSAGGNGAATPSGASATMQAPLIDMQPIFQAMSVQQDQQRIDIQKDLAVAEIGKKGTEKDKIKAQTHLLGKGAARATVESELNIILKKMIDTYKSNYLDKDKHNKKTMREWNNRPKGTPIERLK